jgi:hypothetical protein
MDVRQYIGLTKGFIPNSAFKFGENKEEDVRAYVEMSIKPV